MKRGKMRKNIDGQWSIDDDPLIDGDRIRLGFRQRKAWAFLHGHIAYESGQYVFVWDDVDLKDGRKFKLIEGQPAYREPH